MLAKSRRRTLRSTAVSSIRPRISKVAVGLSYFPLKKLHLLTMFLYPYTISKAIDMSPIITPSDSYVNHLSPPYRRPVPMHIKKLLSDHRIMHLIGSGGFANVYEGTNIDGLAIAVKVPQVKFDETVDSTVLKKFSSEAEIWEKLEHENIVGIYESGIRPVPYIAMELMDGGSLKQLMENHKLTVGEAVQIMQQVLKGLSYAHRMASVHRDLKPDNILFTSDGVAKITDWGIGKFMASTSKSKSLGIKGTLDYCSPEQFNKRQYGKIDWQTDIFQVGVMFYEMVTGTNPFAGEDMADCMGKVLMFEPEPPSSLIPEISEELDEVIMGAIEKKKDDRWKSGDVMLSELRSVTGKKKKRLLKPKTEEWDVPPPPKEERNTCPECGNLIGFDNKKLRCKNCRKFFCETCEGWIDKTSAYKGYKVKVGYPYCEDCYEKEVDGKKRTIEVHIKKKGSEKWRKMGEDRVNSIGMKFKKIPGKSYYMGKYAVTQKEWKSVMGATPWKGKGNVKEGNDYPATYISWDDCQKFAKKLNSKEGVNKYRLPTEAEWEYACGAGSRTKYCFGDDKRRLGEYAWYDENAYDIGEKYAHRVGRKKPNKWGLYDMHGNVWEWCQDWYDDEYKHRVDRGGCWGGSSGLCESSYRDRGTPDTRFYYLGVRLVRSSD